MSAKRVGKRSFFRDEHGAAMVEFALVASLIFIPMVFGIIEFGRLLWAKNTVTAAAREGVRYAIVHGSASGATADSAAVANYVLTRVSLRPLAISTSWTDASKDPADSVTVSVSYTYTPVVVLPRFWQARTVTGVSKQLVAY